MAVPHFWNSVLFFSCIILGLQAQEPKITKSIDVDSKPAGSEGRLSCTVSDKGSATVTWQKLSKGSRAVLISRDKTITTRNPVDSTGEPKYKIYFERSGSATVYTLGVRRLQMGDGGSYMCMIMISGIDVADFPRQTGTLIVQLPPKISQSSTTKILDVIAGERAELNCDATGVPKPKISWSRANGKALPNGQLTLFGSKLLVKKVNETARGVYKCKADNNVRPPATMDITLRVRFPPVMVPFRYSVGQAPDRNYETELTCSVSGDPEPDLAWYKIERSGALTRINDDNKHEVHVIEMHPGQQTYGMTKWLNLRILNVQTGDYGRYLCKGSNIYGESSGNVTMYYTPTCQGALCKHETHGAATSIYSTFSTTFLLAIFIFAVL